MLAKTFTATMLGLEATLIEVEADCTRGKPNLVFIGLPDKTVDEAKERITTALLNCGIRIRAKRTVVNLAPADVRKTASSLELAIAVAIIKMYGEVDFASENTMFFGELSLDGSLKPMKGTLPLILAAKKMGYKHIIFPKWNQKEVQHITDIKLYAATHLSEVISHLKKKKLLTTLVPEPFTLPTSRNEPINITDVRGQLLAKRALEIAAAGGHNVLMIGPPGAGKSMMAKAMKSILPPLSHEEAVEITSIYSVVGKNNQCLMTERPFRSPHHNSSQVGLIGGGSTIKPGEISLAHRGILFLDELPEFSRASLEALRQPLENGSITITRASGSYVFPAKFTLIAAANPCPCGYSGSKLQHCTCNPTAISRYQQKLSGPILDRIDLWVRVREIPLDTLSKSKDNHTDNYLFSLNEKIQKAKLKQQNRYQTTGYMQTSELNSKDIHKYCTLSSSAKQMLLHGSKQLSLSARSYFKIIKIAQTISDLSDSEIIEKEHISEAFRYRAHLFNNTTTS